jgi:hypothetical protein
VRDPDSNIRPPFRNPQQPLTSPCGEGRNHVTQHLIPALVVGAEFNLQLLDRAPLLFLLMSEL